MKYAVIILLAMLLIVPNNVSAGYDYITYNEIDDLVYQFNYTSGNVTDYRWSFGDGATSTEISPVHRFSNHMTYTIVCEVTFDNQTHHSAEVVIDANLPLIDGEDGTVNVGDISFAGGFIFVASFMMLTLATTNNHIGADILGKGGKDILVFLYTLGIVLGGYLIFTSMYGGL